MWLQICNMLHTPVQSPGKAGVGVWLSAPYFTFLKQNRKLCISHAFPGQHPRQNILSIYPVKKTSKFYVNIISNYFVEILKFTLP